VRGYGRRRVGPFAIDRALPHVPPRSTNRLTVADCRLTDCYEPIGGRSLLELSAELRHPITETIDLAGFLDAGQVALDAWHFPFADLAYGIGVGARYRSVIGPLRVDLGFPLDRRHDDSWWQVYLAVGDTF
jgi:outer membrane translocation and assembly module TamA